MILKKSHNTKYFLKCSFILHKFISRLFFIAGGVFYSLKILMLSAILLKWNKTCCIEFFLAKIFVSFVKLWNLSREEYVFFSQSCKISFINDDSEGRKENMPGFFPEWSWINYFVWPQISICTISDLKKELR